MRPGHKLAEKTVSLLAEALERAKLTPHTETVTETVTVTNGPASGWTRVRLWAVPADTTLTAREAAQAIGKSVSAIHKLAARHRLPFTRAKARHSPVTGAPLMFRAADLRRFLGD
jgi:hypothetical protein